MQYIILSGETETMNPRRKNKISEREQRAKHWTPGVTLFYSTILPATYQSYPLETSSNEIDQIGYF